MKNYYWMIIAALFAFILAGCQGEVKEGEEGEEAAETAVMEIDTVAAKNAMKNFIQQKLEVFDGKYPINDVEAEFVSLHEGLKEMDGLYASCADFKVGEDVYDIDLYVKPENGEYTVVKEVLHRKNDELVNEVMWGQE